MAEDSALTTWNAVVGIVAGAATVLALVVTTVLAILIGRGKSPFMTWTMAAAKRSTVGKALKSIRRSAGRTRSRRALTYWHAAREAIESGRQRSVARECQWLSLVASDDPAELTGGFLQHGVSRADPGEWPLHRQFLTLSQAYDQYSARLSAQARLASSAVVTEQQQVASQMAGFLRTEASFAAGTAKEWNPVRFAIPDPTHPNNSAQARLVGEIRLGRVTSHPRYRLAQLSVVPIRSRVLADKDATALARAEEDGVAAVQFPINDHERSELMKKMAGRMFDGVLPTLDSLELQHDPSSGHRRLRIRMGQTQFSAVVARHYVGDKGVGRDRLRLANDAKRDPKRVLSLSLLPVTLDRQIILVQRSSHVAVGAGMIAPGVNGNLELRPRHGVPIDQDALGFGNPLAALCREGREEIGLHVDESRIELLGIGSFSSAEEVGTNVLLTVANVGITTAELVAGVWQADAIEGAWELGKKLIALPVPHDRKSAIDVATWVTATDSLFPSTSLALLALVLPRLGDDKRDDSARLKLQQIIGSRPALPDFHAMGIRTIELDGESGPEPPRTGP